MFIAGKNKSDDVGLLSFMFTAHTFIWSAFYTD